MKFFSFVGGFSSLLPVGSGDAEMNLKQPWTSLKRFWKSGTAFKMLFQKRDRFVTRQKSVVMKNCNRKEEKREPSICGFEKTLININNAI